MSFAHKMRLRTVIVNYLLFIFQLSLVTGKKSGPYKTSMVRVDPCPLAKTTQPIDTDPPSATALELYSVNNYNLLKGNISIFRKHNLKKMKVKNYVWDGNKWKVKFQLSSVGCNRMFFPTFFAAANVNYDLKTCTFYKGVYKFSGININKIEHAYTNVQEYGKTLWISEVYSNVGTISCHEIEMNVEPGK